MKETRHAAILNLIKNQSVETQEELARLLREGGFAVTQATVSRDIKNLRLVKTLLPDGKYHYAVSGTPDGPRRFHPENGTAENMQERFIRIFQNCVLSVASAGNLIVIKTMTGSASAAAEAVDSLDWPEIAGTIAGDNTIFLAVHDIELVPVLEKRFLLLMKQEGITL